MTFSEAHVERLLGAKVHDSEGCVVGRVEELQVEIVDGDHVVTEFHVGGAALLERIAAFMTQLPFLRLIPFARRGYRVSWVDVDLTDPSHPRVLRPRATLTRMSLDSTDAVPGDG